MEIQINLVYIILLLIPTEVGPQNNLSHKKTTPS